MIIHFQMLNDSGGRKFQPKDRADAIEYRHIQGIDLDNNRVLKVSVPTSWPYFEVNKKVKLVVSTFQVKVVDDGKPLSEK